MNGNVKRVDNGEKNKDGKHSCFFILSHKTHETIKKDTAALSVYLELLKQADSRFNATVENIAREVKSTKKTVRAALERLQTEYHLLKIEQEKDISKAAQRKTRRGFTVPNTARLYYVYYEPFQEQAQKKQEVEFTAAEIEQAAFQVIKQEEARPADVQQERRYFARESRNNEPFTRQEKRQEEARPAMIGQQLLLMRIQQVKEIAERHGLVNNRQLEKVLEQLKAFKDSHGYQANDSIINYIAMQVSHDSGYSVNADISLKA